MSKEKFPQSTYNHIEEGGFETVFDGGESSTEKTPKSSGETEMEKAMAKEMGLDYKADSEEKASSIEIDEEAVEHMLDPANILDLKAAYEHERERQQKERAVAGVDLSATDHEAQDNLANDLKTDMIMAYTQTGRGPENPRGVTDETISQISEMMNKSYDELEEELEQKGSVATPQTEASLEDETGQASGNAASVETDGEPNESQPVYEQEPNEELPANPYESSDDVELSPEEELYSKKVGILEVALKEETDANLETQRKVLIKAAGGTREAERVDIWESVKKQEARRSRFEVSDILAGDTFDITSSDEDKDVFDKIATSVVLDMRDAAEPDRQQAGPDMTQFNVGGELEDLIDTDELQDPEVLAKATKTIRLLVENGQYKFNQWGNASQLNTALELIESYAEWVPDFNPKEAGFDEAKASLTMSLAALQADHIGKPNYRYAKPERTYLVNQAYDGLKKLRAAEAHMILRYRDLDIS